MPCGLIRRHATATKYSRKTGRAFSSIPKSYLYLDNTTLDYEQTLMREGFIFQNPQASRSCGCGSSFTA